MLEHTLLCIDSHRAIQSFTSSEYFLKFVNELNLLNRNLGGTCNYSNCHWQAKRRPFCQHL
jgi:hypothetical protein